MIDKLGPIGLILLIGMLWRRLEPGGIPSIPLRRSLNSLNLNLLVPALVLRVMAESQINFEVLLVPMVAFAVIGSCLGCALLAYWFYADQISQETRGSMILASSYGNGIGLAMPVIIAYQGVEVAWVPVLYTLLGSSPLVWTLGVTLAVHHSPTQIGGRLWREMLRSPPLFAVLFGLIANYNGWQYPAAVYPAIVNLADAALPVIVFIVGLSLSWNSLFEIKSAIPALLIKSFVSPVLALLFGRLFGLEQSTLSALVLTAASASFNVGVIISDRYQLDTELYTLVVGFSTIAFLSLSPFWNALSLWKP